MPYKRVPIVSIKMVREKSVSYPNRYIRTPQDAYEFIKPFLQEADREHVIVVCLDAKIQPTSLTTCHIGSLDTCVVHPREVFKTAIISNASSIIIAHNHPSGQPSPSNEDLTLTKRLLQSGEVLGIQVIDHIIIGNDCFYSLKEHGQLH